MISEEILCKAILDSIAPLKKPRNVKAFQIKLMSYLNDLKLTKDDWADEDKHSLRPERDAIDIHCQSEHIVIEIDTTRADQVAKKFLSRLVLWGLNSPINYVAILYPDTRNGKPECEKFLHYCYELLRKVNSKASILGIFVDPDKEELKVIDFKKSCYIVGKKTPKTCNSMCGVVEEVVKIYMKKNPGTSYKELKDIFKGFVNDKIGKSRYKNIDMCTSDKIAVHTFTQFRQNGTLNWYKFICICKKIRIPIERHFVYRLYSNV